MFSVFRGCDIFFFIQTLEVSTSRTYNGITIKI